jgi:phosphatidate phosphatase APP1
MVNFFQRRSEFKRASVKVYHGYGHTHNMVVYGHVFKRKAITWPKFTNNIFYNAFRLLRLFMVKPFPKGKVQLLWSNKVLESTSEDDGFFKFEWQSDHEVAAGWHQLTVNLLDETGNIMASGEGKLFVPHSTQYAFISDIDDTIMVSHSATMGRRLTELFVRNPRTRSIFPDVARHYNLLAADNDDKTASNAFFYVSSSEWNLYDYLNEFFFFHELPKGAFLLNQVKRWYQLLKTGHTKHEGKFVRVVRILEAFPRQQFILFGDNTQRDPWIYTSLAKKLPGKIFAIYIRNIIPENEEKSKNILAEATSDGIHVCLFTTSEEAIAHSKSIGLIRSLTSNEPRQ